jgi:signal transduction histidine kinase/ligand-binding sensor domain-containing protein
MRRLCYSSILCLCMLGGLSQEPQLLYRITEENGLSDNHVRCVIKDHNGFVWIGTADGLNVMDGSGITVFKHRKNDTASISSNDIECLAEDTAGNIWAGTANGLDCFNPSTKKFISYPCPASPYGNSAVVKSIVIENQQRIWCATHGGLFYFDLSQKKFKAFFNAASAGPNNCNRINCLVQGRNGLLWLCTFEGLWSFDPRKAIFKQEISSGNDPYYENLFTAVHEDRNGHIWAASWSHGLKELGKSGAPVITHPLPAGMATTTCILEMQQANGAPAFLVNGLLKTYDPVLNKFTGSLQSPGYPDMSPCYQSADHWIWMASNHGLFIYNPRRSLFRHFLLHNLMAQQNTSFAEWDGKLLLAAQGKDFCKLYDANYRIVKDYNYLLRSFPYPAQRAELSALSLLLPAQQEQVWIGTSNGVAQLNLRTGAGRWLLQQPPDSNGLHKQFMTCMLRDATDSFWLFPWRGGVWQLDTLQQKMSKAWSGFLTENGKTKQLVITSAVQDNADHIWMADLDEGIICYDKKTGVFSKPLQEKTGSRCHSNRIYYRNHHCYSVINSVFTRWSSDLHDFKIWPLPFQMDKEIIDFVADQAGRWWMATRDGLVVLNEATGTFQRFTEADGLQSNDMNGTLYCRNNGDILFATQGCLTAFNPSGLLSASNALPAAILTGIEENGNQVLTRTGQPLQFSHNANNLFFHWTIADYADPFHNQFYCKLNGIDADWRYTGNRGEIQYANLSPGKYELLLRGVTANGVMAANILRVAFIIQTPFWQTAWFIGACMLLTALLVYSWYRYRLQQALKLERLRSKISTDLHDDIGSTLSSISILSDMALREKNHRLNTGMMEEIKENSVLLMEKMDDIVWSINPRNDSLENLVLRVKKFAARLFEARTIDYRFEIQDNIKAIRLPVDYRQHIYLIMKEAINNLVKYSAATEVLVRLTCEHAQLEVIITDNGKGFEPLVSCAGNGILNMQQRAALMEASLQIHSAPGTGTEIRLRLKIK